MRISLFCVNLQATIKTMKKFIYCLVCFIFSVTSLCATEEMTVMANGLTGKVQSCKIAMVGLYSSHLEFDKQGRVIKEIIGDNRIFVYKWGDNGTMTKQEVDLHGKPTSPQQSAHWSYQDNVFTVKFSDLEYMTYRDDGKGKLLKKVITIDGSSVKHNYIYDKSGSLIRVTGECEEDSTLNYNLLVHYDKADSRGNLLRRKTHYENEDFEFTTLLKCTYFDN